MNSYEKYTYPLFETIKLYRHKPYYLTWHQQRLSRSYKRYYGHTCPFRLDRIIDPDRLQTGEGLYKLRFLYNRENFLIETAPYVKREIRGFSLVQADSLDYPLKYTDRTAFDILKNKAKTDEIILVKNDCITDTSFSNIAFYDGDKWFTPAQPLLEGTARARLLYRGKISPAEIKVKDLKTFTRFRLINALLGFRNAPEYSVSHIENFPLFHR